MFELCKRKLLQCFSCSFMHSPGFVTFLLFVHAGHKLNLTFPKVKNLAFKTGLVILGLNLRIL